MITIWHNPRCAKSRQALALLQEGGEAPTVRRYLDDPPGLEELRRAQETLGLRVIEMMRPGEALFRELGLTRTDDAARLLAAMAAHPRLIERPIVFANSRAVIGRPPEKVLEIL